MYLRDSDIVNAIHAERVRDLAVHHAPARGPSAARGGRLRRSVGRSLVRLGAWFAAERPDSLMKTP